MGKVFNEFLVMWGKPNVCKAPEGDAEEALKRVQRDIKKSVVNSW
jgi:hypothetical protein